MFLWNSEKVKNNIPHLNKAVLSNIYGTDRKQGQSRIVIEMVIIRNCRRNQIRENTNEKSHVVFEGMQNYGTAELDRDSF